MRPKYGRSRRGLHQKRLNGLRRLSQLDERALINAVIEGLGFLRPRRFKQRAQQRQQDLAMYKARDLKEQGTNAGNESYTTNVLETIAEYY